MGPLSTLSTPLVPLTLPPSQAWAEASGTYTPGDKPDLPTCKRNFRAALNRKEGLRVAQDLSKDPQDPHKIYEFVTPGALHGWRGTPAYQHPNSTDHCFPQAWGTLQVWTATQTPR